MNERIVTELNSIFGFGWTFRPIRMLLFFCNNKILPGSRSLLWEQEKDFLLWILAYLKQTSLLALVKKKHTFKVMMMICGIFFFYLIKTHCHLCIVVMHFNVNINTVLYYSIVRNNLVFFFWFSLSIIFNILIKRVL